jgi:hypothetical protein
MPFVQFALTPKAAAESVIAARLQAPLMQNKIRPGGECPPPPAVSMYRAAN